MAVQYWVGDFFIDLSRNQITQREQSKTVAPKTLAVLTYLAENQGRVVAYDEFFAEVWPNTVVTPNTLQRSIAQLRKLLGEDSKHQSYIKTHAKQGYSLECNVTWQDQTQATFPAGSTSDLSLEQEHEKKPDLDTQAIVEPTLSQKSGFSRAALGLILVLGSIISLLIYKALAPVKPSDWSIAELRSITASDNKEFEGIYSPDGQYIVFHRYSEELCNDSNIWAKHTVTQQEFQLTKDWGSYGNQTFSKDGKELVFIESHRCEKPITQKKCYKLLSLDFDKALVNPLSPKLLLECKNSKIEKSTWLNNGNVLFMQKFSERWQLNSYSIEDEQSTVIYAPQEGNLIDYDYSVTQDLIALTSVHDDGRHYIEILQPDGQVLSSHPIKYPPEISNLRRIYPNFTPRSDELIFSTGRQLFTLSFDGNVTNISLPIDQPMGSPVFHPNGTRMLVIKGDFDADIATISRANIANTEAGQFLRKGNSNYSIIERSSLSEEYATFQPNGGLVAFISRRSSEDQVWISDGNRAQQLTDLPLDSFINGLDWAADGKSILINANNTLTQVYLDSTQKTFQIGHPAIQLFDWDSDSNTALLIARIKGVEKFIEFDLSNLEYRLINDQKVTWASKSDDGQIIYTDHLDRFWQPGPAEDRLIETLKDQGSNKRFITKENVLYGINEDFQLWSYKLDGGEFEVIGDTPINVDYLTDINATDILLNVRITARKKVAELVLAN